ncbi:HEPN domain-containing protein [Candidatus Micrarchaeota archaeon]|nr:HEPN domain-containing protein [Candidatus Micrarchaeota archaeon]
MNLEDCFTSGSLKKIESDRKNSLKSLETAKLYIEKAEHTLDSKDFDLTIFCFYTSMFHASRALLFKDGIKERSHVCLISCCVTALMTPFFVCF